MMSEDSVQGASDANLQFCLRLTRACFTLSRRLDSALSSVHGLSFGDFMILYYLGRAPGSRLRRIDLAERLGVTSSGVTRTLIPMEKTGWVSRQRDPRDARVGYALLTDAGRELLTHALDSIHPLAAEALRAIDRNQLEDMSAVLGDLAGIHLSNA